MIGFIKPFRARREWTGAAGGRYTSDWPEYVVTKWPGQFYPAERSPDYILRRTIFQNNESGIAMWPDRHPENLFQFNTGYGMT